MNISSIYTSVVPVTYAPSSSLGSSSANSSAVNQRTLGRAVQAVNASELLGPENELTFVVDKAARMVVIRLVNKDTRETVEQIPAQDVVRIAEELNGGTQTQYDQYA